MEGQKERLQEVIGWPFFFLAVSLPVVAFMLDTAMPLRSIRPPTRSASPALTVKTLVPVELAVDANRDGVIKFAGNYNGTAIDLAGKPQDKTEEAKPFRFWINDDNDGTVDCPGSA